MFVSKLALPRRTFLRGAGTVLALPLLDAMVPALTPIARTAAAPVVRMGFIYRPNGYIRQFWTPDKAGANPAFKRSLAALEPFRDRTLIVSGLANLEAEAKGSSPGPHSRSSAAWMTGTHAKQTEGADVQAGISADQVAAKVLGKNTVLPSLELAIEQNEQMVGNCEAGYSCLYQNTISWRTPTTPLPMETHPRVVFQRLFGDGGTPAQQRRQLETSGSILDAVTERLGQLSKKLGPGDRARLEQYTESVREIETRIDKAEKRTADSSVEVPDRPSDIPSGFEEHVKLMFDLQAAAFQADITRVIAFQLARELSPRTYPQIGVNGQHHATSHHGNAAGKINDVGKIDAYHIELVSHYLGKLRSIKEGDSNLLDNSIILLGGGLGNPNEHAIIDLSNLVFGGGGGKIKGNRHLAYKIEDYTPEANLVISLLDRAGVPVDKLGDSTGQLKEIDV
ncbi:MAG: DUF1552 domain-containing protein [Vicinamibacterales bacterium]